MFQKFAIYLWHINVFFLFYKVFMLCHGQESWKLLGHMKTGLLVLVNVCSVHYVFKAQKMISKLHILERVGRLVRAFPWWQNIFFRLSLRESTYFFVAKYITNLLFYLNWLSSQDKSHVCSKMLNSLCC